MSIPPSDAANLPLPRWAYVPGETAEAEADHDTLGRPRRWCRRAFATSSRRVIRRCATAFALNDAGYFWESQEILEAVWAAAPQGGRERILLRACIQIANANLRLRMLKPHAAARLFGEALEELDALGVRQATAGGDGFADGFPTAALAALLEAKLAQPILAQEPNQ